MVQGHVNRRFPRLPLQFKQIRATFQGAEPKTKKKKMAKQKKKRETEAAARLLPHVASLVQFDATPGQRTKQQKERNRSAGKCFTRCPLFYLPYKLKSNTWCLIKKNICSDRGVCIFMLAQVYIYAYRIYGHNKVPVTAGHWRILLATQYFWTNEREKSCASRLQHILYVCVWSVGRAKGK